MAIGDYLAGLDLSPGAADRLSGLAGVDSASMIPPPPPGSGEPSPAVVPTRDLGEIDDPRPSALSRGVNGFVDGVANAYNPLYGAQQYEAKLSEDRKSNEHFGPPRPPPTMEAKPVYGQAPIVVRGATGGGVGARPAGWVPGSKSVAEHPGMTGEELAPGAYHRDVAAGQRLLGADKHLEASQVQANAEVALAQAHQDAVEADRARQERIGIERAQYVQDQQAKLEKLSLDARKQVDPELARGSAGAQIMSAIAVALGQYGASITGGQNTAYQIVKDRINQNIEAQRDNIANAGKALDHEQGLYKQNLEEFGDKARASIATKVSLLEQAKAETDKQFAKARGTMNEGDYHELVAKLNADIANEKDTFAKLSHNDITMQSNAHYQQAQAGTGAGVRGLGDPGHDAEYVPSLEGYASTKEDATLAKEHDFRTRTINATLEEVKGILKESEGLSTWRPADIKKRRELQGRLDSLANSAAVKQTVKEGQGAQSKGDKEVSDQTLSVLGSKVWGPEFLIPGAPTYYDGINRKNSAVIGSVQERAIEEHRRLSESMNISPGKRVMVEDKNGNLQPHRVLTGKRMPLTSRSIGVEDIVPEAKGQAK